MITLYGPHIAGIALVAGFILYVLHKTAVDAARRNGRNEMADFLIEAIDPTIDCRLEV